MELNIFVYGILAYTSWWARFGQKAEDLQLKNEKNWMWQDVEGNS
jgi:hypothetical protein